jgi:tRNA modification GTPase
MVEAELDFADEADVAGSASAGTWADLAALQGEIERHVGAFHRAEIVQQGFRAVLIGAPNSGKSSLLNALARRDVAIVTEEAGTTRDLIEVALDLGGVKVLLTDTAGIRTAAGPVEKIGIERALQRAAGADLVLRIVDLSGGVIDVEAGLGVPCLRIGTKADLLDEARPAAFPVDHAVSSLTGAGLDSLTERLREMACAAVGAASDILPSRLRHVELLSACSAHIGSALARAKPADMRAEELRLAGDALGRITGAVDVEDLLDHIFSRFCIGK